MCIFVLRIVILMFTWNLNIISTLSFGKKFSASEGARVTQMERVIFSYMTHIAGNIVFTLIIYLLICKHKFIY